MFTWPCGPLSTAATGGSTNAVLHLLAIAATAGAPRRHRRLQSPTRSSKSRLAALASSLQVTNKESYVAPEAPHAQRPSVDVIE